MSKPWKTILAAAVVGLAVAGVCYAFAALHDYSKPWTGLDTGLVLVSVILCPPQLIFAFCIDCEVVGWSGFIQYLIIAGFNTALYAAVAGAVVSMRKNKSKSG